MPFTAAGRPLGPPGSGLPAGLQRLPDEPGNHRQADDGFGGKAILANGFPEWPAGFRAPFRRDLRIHHPAIEMILGRVDFVGTGNRMVQRRNHPDQVDYRQILRLKDRMIESATKDVGRTILFRRGRDNPGGRGKNMFHTCCFLFSGNPHSNKH